MGENRGKMQGTCLFKRENIWGKKNSEHIYLNEEHIVEKQSKECFYLNGEHIGKKNREHIYVNEEHIGEKRRGNKIGNKNHLNGNSGGTGRGGGGGTKHLSVY
jgi:hypothetical protein